MFPFPDHAIDLRYELDKGYLSMSKMSIERRKLPIAMLEIAGDPEIAGDRIIRHRSVVTGIQTIG